MNTKEYISSGIIESYILGLASREEAGIFECVIKNNADVKAAFEEAQQALENFTSAQAVTPPQELRQRIWDRIVKEGQHPEAGFTGEQEVNTPPVAVTEKHKPLKIQSYNWKITAVAASVLFFLSVASNIIWMTDRNDYKVEVSDLHTELATQQLALQKMQQKWKMLSDPDMQVIPLKGVDGHAGQKALVFWHKESKKVYLNAENLPKAPEGMQYQLWAIVDGTPVDAGMYTEEKDSEVALSTIPAAAQTFAITLEKRGGSAVPTMENMFVIGTIGT